MLPESGGLAAFSPDGELLATGSWQGQIKLWNPTDGTLVKTLTNANRVVSLRFSPDGRTLVACSFDDGTWLYDIAAGQQRPVARGHDARVFDAEISPDGRTLATGSADQTVRLWEMETGRQKAIFLGHSYTVSHVTWSRDGKILASGGQDGTVRLWKVEQAASSEESVPGQVERRFFSPDGRMLAVVHPVEGVTLRKFPSLEVMGGPHKSGVPLGFLPGGEAFATFRQATNDQAEILRWSVPDFRLLSQQTLDAGTNTLRVPTLSADGRWFAAGLDRAEAGLWDLSGESKLTRLAAAEVQAALAMTLVFSPDSRSLAGTFMDSTLVHVWQVQTSERFELGRHAGFIPRLVYSADGRQLISADGDKFIKVWDLAERKEIATLLGHRAGIAGLDLSPDGKTVVSSSGDRTVRLWNLATRREVARFQMESQVDSVAFAPDRNALFLTRRGNGQSSPATVIWRAPDFAETDLGVTAPAKDP
jgi:WD40 repeat protein